jgi:murein DD-endopeptidase MepM/ murein hydrolase activator NlpD
MKAPTGFFFTMNPKNISRLLPILLALVCLGCFAVLAIPIVPGVPGGGQESGGGKNSLRPGMNSGAHPPPGGDCAGTGVDHPDNPFRGWPVERFVADWSTISAWYCDPNYFKGYTHWGIDLASRIHVTGSKDVVYETLDMAPVTCTALKAIVTGSANDGGHNHGMGNYVILRHVTCTEFCGSIPAKPIEGHHFSLIESGSDQCPVEVSTPAPRATPEVEYGDLIRECVESGWKASYFHLKDTAVAVDDLVEYGDVLGWIDNTGNSTGPHLHYQINTPPDQGEKAIDPAPAMCDDYNNGLRAETRWHMGLCANLGYPNP